MVKRKNKNLFSNGWYIPPPYGVSILFGGAKDLKRISYPNLRLKQYWPNKNIFFDRQGFIIIYASPVDRSTGIIGDFAMTIYLGINKNIQKHLKNCYETTRAIFESAKLGMRLCQLNTLTHKILESKSLINNIISSSDLTGTNTGHTIPFSYESRTIQEQAVFKKNDCKEIALLISKKRKFVNAVDQTKIQKNMAFTIEPRLYSANFSQLPAVLFHTIALFHENGKKELLTDFEDIFKLTGMDYMLES